MEMTIDEIIKYLPAPICGSTVIDSEKQKEYEAHDKAVIIMRKYQKIQEILNRASYVENGTVYSYTYDNDSRVKHIRKVVEDGKADRSMHKDT